MANTLPADFCPYKGLQPYTQQDRAFFFGRERDQQIIISNLYASQVTVFYGASGVGKSSVLLAGSVPLLQQEKNLAVVVFRSWQGPTFLTELKTKTLEAVNQAAGREIVADLSLPLDEFLEKMTRALRGPIFFIFDQFEEYFLYNPGSASSDGFEAEFARSINRKDVNVNFLLSLREDGLSKLDRFQGRIPTLLSNMLRLEHLDAAAAREAITKPLDVYKRQLQDGQAAMTIEPELVEAVLNDLRGVKVNSEQAGRGQVGQAGQRAPDGKQAEIETPFLQMVLRRLWDEERAVGSHVLRLQTFEALGRAENIARTHLDNVMSKLTAAEHNDAASILRYLVTPSGTKIAQEPGALVSWTELTEKDVQAILTRLSADDMRILRTIQAPDQPTRYEIFHDVLAHAILNWRRRYVEEQKVRIEVERAKTEAVEARKRARAKLMPFVVGGLLVIVLVMIYLTYKAYQSTFIATASSLAVYSRTQLNTDPELSLLLAIEAVDKLQIPQSIEALKESLVKSHLSTVMTPEKNGRISGVAFSPDGKYVVTASWNDTAEVWEAATGKSVSLLAGHKKDVNSASFSPDGKYVITASKDNTARVWQGWQTGNPTVVTIIDEKDEAGTNEIWTAAFSPDGQYILTGGAEGKVRVWEWRQDPPAIKAELTVASAINALKPQPTPNSSPSPGPIPTPAADLSADPAASPTPLPTPSKRVQVFKAVFSPDGQYIMIAARDNTGLVWDWQNGTGANNLSPLRGHRFALYDAAFSPDGKYAITGSDDSTAIVWELSNPAAQIATIRLGTNQPRGVAFSPDGNSVATASYDKVARLWSRESKFARAVDLRGHRGLLMCIAFSPDGKFVVTGSDDGTARVWRTETLDRAALDKLSVDELLKLARARLRPERRELTPDERQEYQLEKQRVSTATSRAADPRPFHFALWC